MFDAAEGLREEYAELEAALADPATHTDMAKARKVGRRYSELTPIIKNMDAYESLTEDLEAAKELAAEDESFAGELEEVQAQLEDVTEKLTKLLAPRDPHDTEDVLMEIKAGAGGEESALFAEDLLNMYKRYAEHKGWKTEILDEQLTDLGGVKNATIAIKATKNAEPENMPYGVLKFEGGVHRVQRVPVTESQGRIHTSAAGVLVMPDLEADDSEIEIDEKDIRIDIFRSSGPGGQGVNTTDSAVRITHLPTGIVVSSQNERSQLQNKESAMRVLRARLKAKQEEDAAAEAAEARHSQVRTLDRSERIRTYNFPENRISDHRIGYKAYNLDQVLNGDLQAVVDALQAADLAERLGVHD
ncbi:MAG: peptide chain release factor 1 [Propionibacteriaceae bacterium]|jgi:peptide chain release factor 1|nr:peptide chain release factor 1 [Propionibacteriaceae bacterium]